MMKGTALFLLTSSLAVNVAIADQAESTLAQESSIYDGVTLQHGLEIAKSDDLVSLHYSEGNFEERIVNDATDFWSLGLEHKEYAWVSKPEIVERHRLTTTRRIVDRLEFSKHTAQKGLTWGLLSGLIIGGVLAGVLSAVGAPAILGALIGLGVSFTAGLIGRKIGFKIGQKKPEQLPTRVRYYEKHTPIKES